MLSTSLSLGTRLTSLVSSPDYYICPRRHVPTVVWGRDKGTRLSFTFPDLRWSSIFMHSKSQRSPILSRSEGCSYIGRNSSDYSFHYCKLSDQRFSSNKTQPHASIKPLVATLISSKSMLVKKIFMRFHKTAHHVLDSSSTLQETDPQF